MLPASGGSQGASVAVLSGELDLNSVQAVQTLTDPAVLSPGATLVLDLSAVTFMDSYGINAIVGAHFRVAAAQGQLVLRSPSPAVRAVLRLTDVDAFIPIEPSSTAVTELGRKPVNGW